MSPLAIRRVTTTLRATRSSNLLQVDPCRAVANGSHHLDRILYAWLREAILIEGYLPNSLRTLDSSFEHQWFWDGHEHVDPAKEANAQKIRLAIIRQLWPMNTRGRGVIGRRNLNNARKRSRSCASWDSRPIQLHFLQEM